MFIKIFFDDKPLYLCDEITTYINEYVHHDDAIFIDELNSHTIKSMIHEMQVAKVHAGVFYHKDFDELKKAFFKKFTFIQAAGGLVTNEDGDVLLIFRRGKWDLPKGKLDKGEKLDECAVREVEEETGLKKPKIEKILSATYHTYHEGARYILKESNWYKMKIIGEQNLVPQTNEGIEEIKWVRPDKLKTYYSNTYPNVVEILQSWSDK
ncbi:MAG: NUDIX domain-containing protein [Bacteroidetes bacterium]|nr:MAG: NUDIX domain-containing protein [Bacteroidota bacterium]